MNILRWKRKSKNKDKKIYRTIILFIFSLIMTTFAWFAYSKILEPTLQMHMSSWDMEYYIDSEKKTNPISLEIPILYPTMEEQTVIVDIHNNGEKQVDIDFQVKSLTIAGRTYEGVYEGFSPTSSQYITIAPSVIETDETTSKQICKGAVTNDVTKFPFTIEIEHSAQVDAVTENDYGTKVPGEGYLKVTVNWIGDNDRLDSEWGYIVGDYLANHPEVSSAMSIVLSIDSYQVDPEGTEIETIMPTTSTTRPYLPEGYKRVPGTSLTTGLVVEDANGNQYVWVEVPKSTTVYTTAGIEITEFTSDEYSKIETDLINYVSAYSTRTDTYYNYDAIGVAETNYNTLKQKMLKSIYTYGGFYIGRYETGVEGEPRTRATSTTPSDTPVIKPHVYSYNWVTCAQAHTISSRLAQTGYTTSLMFGLQWDLVMKYLETKGVAQSTLKTDSTQDGNYLNNTYTITNSKAKYNQTTTGWLNLEIMFDKNTNAEVLIGSGANSGFCMQNIYDLAGNLSEWTYNVAYDSSTNGYVGGNGGNYMTNGDTTPASLCETYNVRTGLKNIGFRVSLVSDISAETVWGGDGSSSGETTSAGTYLPTGFTEIEDPETDVTIQDGSGNQYVWVSVPQTTAVYPTAGLAITEFTDTEYTVIENDLHTYTSVYRDNTTYTDTWSSESATGLTETQYYTLKKKMLKSVYQNGGFYVGKYETGIEGSYNRNYALGNEQYHTEHPITDTPVIKQNAYVYDWVRCSQAQTLASSMASGEYTSSLMFGVQWDLVLKYMETKGATQEELKSNSTNWGNYYQGEYSITNTNAKYSVYNGSNTLTEYELAPYTKNANTTVRLTTGASEVFSKAGIYDIAGNAWEWTLEKTSNSSNPCAYRGGDCDVRRKRYQYTSKLS